MGVRTIPIIILIGMVIYFYTVLLRVDKYFKLNLSKMILVFILLLILLPAINVFGIWFLTLLHLFEIGIVIEISNLLLKRFDLKFWDFLYGSFLLPIVLTILLFCYGYYNITNIKRVEYNLVTDKNIGKSSYKLGYISDIHFENTINSKKLSKLVERLKKENFDILLLGGDIVDEGTTLEGVLEVFNLLGDINTQEGIYYVYGNHDMSRYRKIPNYTIKDLKDSLEKNQINLLDDSSVEVNRNLVIIGRKDKSLKNRKESEKLTEKIDLGKYLILLDHQPVELKNNSQLGYDLQLSGHTHNGQIFPFNLIIKKFNLAELIYGYKKIGTFDVIVSSGASGWGYPIRTTGQSEYIVINISGKEG